MTPDYNGPVNVGLQGRHPAGREQPALKQIAHFQNRHQEKRSIVRTVTAMSHLDIAHRRSPLETIGCPAAGRGDLIRHLIVILGCWRGEGEVCPLPHVVESGVANFTLLITATTVVTAAGGTLLSGWEESHLPRGEAKPVVPN